MYPAERINLRSINLRGRFTLFNGNVPMNWRKSGALYCTLKRISGKSVRGATGYNQTAGPLALITIYTKNGVVVPQPYLETSAAQKCSAFVQITVGRVRELYEHVA